MRATTVAKLLLGTRVGRRGARWALRRYARRTLDRVRWRPLLYVPAVVTFARMRRRLGPPPAAVTLAAVYATPLVIGRALPNGRVRTYLTWLAHMWAYKVAFEVPYDRPHQSRKRLRIDEPIAVDPLIGLGVPPSRFPGAAVRLGLTFDLTLLGYFAVPTAPPWWASEVEGRMDGEVRRVNVEVIRALRGEPRPGTPEDHVSGSNPWAAWPSDHFASALSAAIALAEADRRAGALGFAYAAGLGFVLVYSGEHYGVDLLLGAALALAVHGAGTAVTGRAVR